MRYKLINEPNPNYDAVTQVLVNRGIDFKQLRNYIYTSDDIVGKPEDFGEENLKKAVAALILNIKQDKPMLVVIDSDCDGFTSSALLINYLYDNFPSYVENNLKWYMHTGKQHGLNDCIDEAMKYPLVMLPDSSSNDYEYHARLVKNGSTVIVLDHHEAEKISEDAIVINNQLSDYKNKELSGVGVTWQFCRYIDKLMHVNYADNYLDLVALGNTADMMDLRSEETKHLIQKGFEADNIRNPFVYGIADKNSYSLGGSVTSIGAAFYIAPFVNAMVRSGTQQEKELLFASMLKFKAFIQVDSTKRGHSFGEQERILDQALRTCTNVKNRQTKAQEAGLEFLAEKIEKERLLENKFLLLLMEPGQIDKNIAGLIANKLMAKYQRPCCILTKVEKEIEGVEGGIEVSYQGSARGYEKSGLADFKALCSKSPSVLFAEGHGNAFGLSVLVGRKGTGEEEVFGESLLQFIDFMNHEMRDVNSDPLYYLDYLFKGKDVDGDKIISIANMDTFWGKGVEEAFVGIEGLKITPDMVTLMSPDKKPTLKITLPNNVSIIKFKSSQEEKDSFINENGFVEINGVFKCNVNNWNGVEYPQLFLEDFEVTDISKIPTQNAAFLF